MGDVIRVLHVDDEPDVADLTGTYLERQNSRLSVETATSAEDGLDQLSADIDCVVSDYDMPGLNGIEFLDSVRQQYPDLPFILFTGKGSEEVASDAISAGVTDYLQKGAGTEQYELLANRITNAVEQTRARTQAEEQHRVSTVVRDINQALVQATDHEEISLRVCQILADADPYVFAWIGTVDATTDRVEPRAAAGHDEGYLDDITVTVDDSPTGRGPGGTALRENRVTIIQNIRDDELFAPWQEEALDRGYRSVACIPLTHDDTQYGLLAVYADRVGAFDESERALLSELGDTIAHAYHRVELQRQYQDQYRELFEEAPVMFAFTREVAGEPIIEECNQLFAETLGYTREELRGTRLAEVYTDESARALLGGGGYDRALTGEFIREQRDFVTRDGEVVETLLRATPRRNTEGDVIGTHALFVDITDQTRLQTLEELRERMEFALEATDSVLFERDLDTGEEIRHGPFDRLYGLPSDNLDTSEEFYEQCVHPADRDELRALQRRESLADTDGTVACDFRTHPDRGDQRWIRFEAYVSTDPNGAPQRLIGLNTDMTERTEHEQELERYREYMDRIFDAIDDVFFVYDTEGTPQRWNESFTEVTGYTDDEIASMTGTAFVPAEYREQTAARITEGFETGHARLETPVLRKDGTRTPYEFVANRVEHPNGEPRLVGIGRDITDRKQRDEELKRKERIIQEMDDGVVVVQDQTITYTNPQISEIIGYPAAELVGEPMGKYIAPADRETVRRRYEERLAGNEPPKTYEISLLTRNGETVPVEITAARVTYGDEPATVSIVRDITDRKERIRELERHNERLEKFASIVSHDLRNPLNVAVTRLELAQDACESPHLTHIADAHDRMEGLIDDLLTLARQGEQVREMDTISLTRLSEQCWETVETAGATLEVNTDRTIRADGTRLKQVLENLIRNAIEHGGAGVTVRIGDMADAAGFYVADDGPGIPADSHDDVFASGYSTADEGTGFGLAIVREIVEAHGWEISVTDSADGGARFEITQVDIAAE